MPSFEHVSQDPLLGAWLTEALAAVEAEEGSILLREADSLRFAISCSPVADSLVGQRQPLSRGIMSLACVYQQPMVVNDVQGDENFDPAIDARTGVVTRSVLVVPLVAPQAELGALTALNSRKPGGFSASDLDHFCQLAARVTARLLLLDADGA